MRVLVIGGTQFIGPYVVRRLSRDGHDVTVFHRGRTEADLPQDVRHIHGERERLPEFRPQFEDFAPDVVLDMRALTEQDIRQTIDSVQGVAKRLVAISSMDVYHAYGILTGFEVGAVEPTPLTEDSPVREKLYLYRGMKNSRLPDVDNYDKILIERLVLGNPEMPGTILRLPMVYGPGDGQHRLWPYLKRMDDGRPAILLGEKAARRHFARSYVENVATAIALAVTDERAAGRVYNVAEPEPLDEQAWVALIAERSRLEREDRDPAGRGPARSPQGSGKSGSGSLGRFAPDPRGAWFPGGDRARRRRGPDHSVGAIEPSRARPGPV